jgi:lyso-ornithine lipid O-acyltransferase
MSTWDNGDRPAPVQITAAGWVRVLLRGGPIAVSLLICFPALLLLRLPERLIFGTRRPLTPWITKYVCITILWVIGLKRHMNGVPLKDGGAMVANHAAWLDIFVLNAAARVTFVSKSEVAGWPGIGWLARGTGTIFIRRARSEAARHQALLETRMQAGDRLVFFPEGTSTDGQRILPLKSTLFEVFFSDDMKHKMKVQPVSIRYQAPDGADPRFYAWWGDMDFGPSLLKILAAPRHGAVHVTCHPPLDVAGFTDRKALAAACEAALRAGFSAAGR